MKYFYSFVLLLLFIPDFIYAQSTTTINGYVLDSETKETLIGATIAIEGTKLGAATNTSGFFAIASAPEGKHVLRVSLLGYKKQTITVELQSGETKKLTIELKPESIQAQEVVVEADKEKDDKREITVSRYNIPMQQIQQLRIGGEADVFRTLQYLPGVLTSSQISSGLFIRGGSPDQTLVLLDGSTVYNPAHLFGFFSSFNPEAIKDVDLIKGGFPAEFGGRMSAVLNLTQKDGNKEKFEGLVSLGLISARTSLQGPIGNGSWFLGGRRTYFDAIRGTLPKGDNGDEVPNFFFYDVNAKVSQTISLQDKVFVSFFRSRDRLEVNNPGIKFNLGISNTTGAARWTRIMNDNMFSSINFSGSTYTNGFDGDQTGYKFSAENVITDYTLRQSLEWYSTKDLTIKGGTEITWYEFSYNQNYTGGDDSANTSGTNRAGRTNLKTTDWNYSAFTQLNYQFTPLLSGQAGVRGSYYKLGKQWTIDPRVSLRYQLQSGVAIKAAWGMYHQYLRLASNPDFVFFDTWLPTDESVKPSRADHYILGLETSTNGYDVNFDLYYKQYANISEFRQTVTQGNQTGDFFYNGKGKAYGAEIFIQKKTGKLTGWIGYALGFVNSTFADINDGRSFRPKFDRRNDFKAVMTYQLSDRWEMGAVFTFQTGQSYTGVTSRFESRLPGEETGTGVTVPAERYGLRLPPSHQLNVNFARNTSFFGLPAKFLVDIYNVYSRRDIWFRYYDTKNAITEVKDVQLLPIIPTISYEVKF